MVLGFDLFGFVGSKRRSALQILDRALTQFEVNPAYIDNGMRFLIYRWVEQLPPATIDTAMREAAAMISYCVLGPTETETAWGKDVRTAREERFRTVLSGGVEDSLDARLIKLALAKGIASPEISAVVQLE